MMEFHAEIEMQEQKVGRGGAREGAGRKRMDVHYYGFRACQRGTRHPFRSGRRFQRNVVQLLLHIRNDILFHCYFH